MPWRLPEAVRGPSLWTELGAGSYHHHDDNDDDDDGDGGGRGGYF